MKIAVIGAMDVEVENLKTYFDIEGKKCTAVDGISFVLNKGETMAVIGESGSGKSVTALSIMGLIDYSGKIAEGKIIFNGEDLLKKKEINKFLTKTIIILSCNNNITACTY